MGNELLGGIPTVKQQQAIRQMPDGLISAVWNDSVLIAGKRLAPCEFKRCGHLPHPAFPIWKTNHSCEILRRQSLFPPILLHIPWGLKTLHYQDFCDTILILKKCHLKIRGEILTYLRNFSNRNTANRLPYTWICRVGITNATPKALETLGFWGFLLPFDNNLITNTLNWFVLFVLWG